MMKQKRHKMITQIVEEYDIPTQEQLAKRLAEKGVVATQATICRDIKELMLIKVPSKDGQKYAVSGKVRSSVFDARLRAIFKEGVIGAEIAQNIIVLKTLPGLAHAACGAIDSIAPEGFVGSIAGDDTGFLLMRDNQTAEVFYKNYILKSF